MKPHPLPDAALSTGGVLGSASLALAPFTRSRDGQPPLAIASFMSFWSRLSAVHG